MPPFGRGRDGWRGRVPVDAARARRVVRARIRQALRVTMGDHMAVGGVDGCQARVGEGGERGGEGEGGSGQWGGAVRAPPQAGQLVQRRQGAAVTSGGLRHPQAAIFSQLATCGPQTSLQTRPLNTGLH